MRIGVTWRRPCHDGMRLLVVLSVVVVMLATTGCAGPDRGPAASGTGAAPTSTLAVAAVPPPAASTTTTARRPRGYERVLLATDSDAHERDVLKALRLIEDNDSRRFQGMRAAVYFWKIFACFTEETCSDRSLGETQPANDPLLGCSTWIGFGFVERAAAAVRIPYLYFLAFVLVHEWVHCLPAGWSSEVPSLRA
jgi:hypothetical protein